MQKSDSPNWSKKDQDAIQRLLAIVQKNVGMVFILSFLIGFGAGSALNGDVQILRIVTIIAIIPLYLFIPIRLLPKTRKEILAWFATWAHRRGM